MENILLSICIPTYNGGNSLDEALNCALAAIKCYTDVEIVVSDNCSSDNTPEILAKFEREKRVRVNRNVNNLGFNGNMLLLLEKLARGKYCWILGDDDYISSDSIELLHDLLISGRADYVAVGFQTRYIKNYKRVAQNGRTIKCTQMSYFEVMDSMASLDNILGTFMSFHIFNLDMVKAQIKDEERGLTFDTFANIFPNSTLMTDAFHGSNRCFVVNNVLIEAIYRPSKSYDDKWGNLVENIFPKYYDYCLSLGGNSRTLKHNRHIIQDISLQKNIALFLKGHFREVSFGEILSFSVFGSAYRYFRHQYEKRLR